jgi:hypothetical protein
MLQPMTEVLEMASDFVPRYARQWLGALVEPSVSAPEAENDPLTKRSSVAVASIWKVRAALVETFPSTYSAVWPCTPIVSAVLDVMAER